MSVTEHPSQAAPCTPATVAVLRMAACLAGEFADCPAVPISRNEIATGTTGKKRGGCVDAAKEIGAARRRQQPLLCSAAQRRRPALLPVVRLAHPDVALIDIRMPPTHTDEGLIAAQTIRAELPQVGVLVLSEYVEPAYAMRLLQEQPERVGYLLKERVFDIAIVVDALRRITDGETVIDPTIVSRMLGRRRRNNPIETLSEREREVLGLIAEGMSNRAIAARLFVTERTVEAHVTQIFQKLRLPESADQHRRVLAVLAFLRS